MDIGKERKNEGGRNGKKENTNRNQDPGLSSEIPVQRRVDFLGGSIIQYHKAIISLIFHRHLRPPGYLERLARSPIEPSPDVVDRRVVKSLGAGEGFLV